MFKHVLKNDYESFYSMAGICVSTTILVFCFGSIFVFEDAISEAFLLFIPATAIFFWSGIKYTVRFRRIKRTLVGGQQRIVPILDFQVIANDQALLVFEVEGKESRYRLKMKKKERDCLEGHYSVGSELMIMSDAGFHLPIVSGE